MDLATEAEPGQGKGRRRSALLRGTNSKQWRERGTIGEGRRRAPAGNGGGHRWQKAVVRELEGEKV
jgi:hypothetical protein